MREYIELEFTAALADKQLTFTLDVERVIDDVVLFCMLVGNDFLPGEQAPGAGAEGYQAVLVVATTYLGVVTALRMGRSVQLSLHVGRQTRCVVMCCAVS
jgi:5'-3' exonuclease